MPGNEKEQLLYDLDHYVNWNQIEDVNNLWNEIIEDISNYNSLESKSCFIDVIPDCPLIQIERPDAVYVGEKTEWVMGIECFQFDASSKTKKGSRQVREEMKTQRAIQDERKLISDSKKDDNGCITIKKNVNVDLSFENYINSLMNSFFKHISNILEYRKNLEKKYPRRKVYLTLFIDDKTAIGNYVKNNGKTEALTPLRIPYFLNFLKQLNGLDYVAVKTVDSYVPQIQIMSCDKESIDKMMKHCYKDDAQYISYVYSMENHFYSMTDCTKKRE